MLKPAAVEDASASATDNPADIITDAIPYILLMNIILFTKILKLRPGILNFDISR